MRILFLARSLNYGGAERQLTVLARGLRRRGHTVAVALFYPEGNLRTELAEDGIEVVSLDKRGRWDTAAFLLRLVRTVRAWRPDLLHSYLVVPNVMAALVKPLLGMPVVWGIRASNMDTACYDRSIAFAYRCEALLARVPDLMIANSHAGAAYHAARGYPVSRLQVVPNGIATVRFVIDRARGEALRRRWGGDDCPLIGVVGRLDPMKDYATFLRALAQVPAARAVIVGEGTDTARAELQALASSLQVADRIVWEKAGTDMVAAYNAFDLLCLPSAFGEGFPNVVGEAMACGIPCVVTDVGDSARLVGTLGEVAPPREPAALAAALQRLLARRSREPDLGAQARETVCTAYAEETMVAATEALLLRLVAR